MKKLAILLLIAGISANQIQALSTSHSLFSIGLAAAQDEKANSGGKFRDQSYLATLAAQWDLLPENTAPQKEAKEQGRKNFIAVFNIDPNDVDLSKMTNFINLTNIRKQLEEKLNAQISDLNSTLNKAKSDYKKVSSQFAEHKKTLDDLSKALNTYSTAFKNLFKALKASEDAHTEQAGDLSAQELDTLKSNLERSQAVYNTALENLQDKGVEATGNPINLSNNFLNIIIRGELSKYTETAEPVTNPKLLELPNGENTETPK